MLERDEKGSGRMIDAKSAAGTIALFCRLNARAQIKNRLQGER